MQTEIIYLIIGILAGSFGGCFIYSLIIKSSKVTKYEYNSLNEKFIALNNDFSVENERVSILTENLKTTEAELRIKTSDNIIVKEFLASKVTELEGIRAQFEEFKADASKEKELYNQSILANQNLSRTLATVEANLEALKNTYKTQSEDFKQLKIDIQSKTDEFNQINKLYERLNANNIALQEKWETQKDEIEKLREKFNTDFENIANKIFDDKLEEFCLFLNFSLFSFKFFTC